MDFKLAVLTLLLLLKKSSGKAQYDCRRLEDCGNGGTCNVEGDKIGTCSCPSGYGGYNCRVIEGTTCDDPAVCQNEGTCYKDAGNIDTCGCKYGYIGDTCNGEYVSVDCSGASMKIGLSFPSVFGGIVSLDPLDPASPPPDSCDFATAASADGVTSVNNLDIKVNDATTAIVCGQEHLTSLTDADTGAVTYRTYVRVQYDQFIFSPVDEIYNISCIHTGADVNLYSDITNLDVSPIGNFSMVERNKTYSPVKFDIIDVDGNHLTADTKLYVGSPFLFYLYLTDITVYRDILIDSCTTNNTMEGDDLLEYKIFENGCPTKAGRKVTDEQVSRLKGDLDGDGVPEPGKSITIKAFKFVDTDQLGIMCTAKVCKAGEESECQIPSDCNAVINAPKVTPTATSGTESTAAGTTATETGATSAVAETSATKAGTTSAEAATTASEAGTTATETGTTAAKTDTTAIAAGTTGSEAGTPGTETGTTAVKAGTTATETGTTAVKTDTTATETDTTAGGTGTSASEAGTTVGGTGTSSSEAGATAGGTGTSASEAGTTAGGTGTSASEAGTTAGGTGTSASEAGTTAGETGTSASEAGTTATETGTTAGGTGTTSEAASVNAPGATGGESVSEGGTATGNGGAGLRKRRAASNERKKETVSAVVTVIGPSDYHSVASRESKVSKVEDCLIQEEILAVFIVIGSVVVILFITCFILACMMVNRKSNRNKSDFESLVSYRTNQKSDKFHIPRAHVNDAYSHV